MVDVYINMELYFHTIQNIGVYPNDNEIYIIYIVYYHIYIHVRRIIVYPIYTYLFIVCYIYIYTYLHITYIYICVYNAPKYLRLLSTVPRTSPRCPFSSCLRRRPQSSTRSPRLGSLPATSLKNNRF